MSTSDERAEELQREGQNAYRKKEFGTALQLFSQALNTPNITPILQIRILDNRAAVQEKIGGIGPLRAALADAKKMIQLQKTSANGYLRAGKVLQLQGSDSLALDIYNYGLKRLSPSDNEGKSLIGGMRQKVLTRIERPKFPKTLDVMSILPLELVEMILHYLPFQTLILAQRVSKSWRQFLSNHQETYTTVDFSAAKRPVRKHALKMCVNHSKGRIKKIILSQLGFSSDEPLIYLALRCKDLSHIEILETEPHRPTLIGMAKATPNLKTLIIGNPMDINTIATIINECPTLECLECSRVKFRQPGPVTWHPGGGGKLRKLHLAFKEVPVYFRLLQLETLLEQLPELRELELMDFQQSFEDRQLDFTTVPHLTLLTLSNSSLTCLPLLPPTITHLNLANNPRLIITPPDILASPLPVLESLNIASNPKLTNTLLTQLLSTHSLRSLTLNMCPSLDFETVDWLLDPGYGAQLEQLSVVGNPTFGDWVSKELGGLKMLKRLDIGFTRISGIGVLNLIRMSRKEGDRGLEWVGCDGCQEVGHDAVVAVKEMGVSVSHRMGTGEGRKGKKIRYGD